MSIQLILVEVKAASLQCLIVQPSFSAYYRLNQTVFDNNLPVSIMQVVFFQNWSPGFR